MSTRAVVKDIPPADGGDAPVRPRRRRWLWVVAGLPAALVLASVLALAIFHAAEGRPVPAFPSLAEHPDTSLHGTVAYYDVASRCVRIVAAAGQPSRDVLCVAPWQPPWADPAKVATEGKEIGPQLVWLADGRLEVTMMFMQVGPTTKDTRPGWQKIVDVRGGLVDDVPAADVPSEANRTARATVSPNGARISWTSSEPTGRIKVTLTDATGTRTLMSAHGPGEYSYRLYSAFWAPNWQWIAADDGRILVITPNKPSVTRVLVDTGGGSREYPTFAVAPFDVLTPPR